MENNRHPAPVTISPHDSNITTKMLTLLYSTNLAWISQVLLVVVIVLSLSLFVYLVQYSFMSSCIYHKNQDNKSSITSTPNVILLCASLTERRHFHFSLSCTGEGNGNPLQCSCRENPRDRGAWWAAVYGVAQSRRLK